MPRGQDLLDEAITLISGAGQGAGDAGGPGDPGLGERATSLADRLTAQREKFFFKSLAGVPLANKVKKAGQALSGDRSSASMDVVEALVGEIEDKADAPGTVLT